MKSSSLVMPGVSLFPSCKLVLSGSVNPAAGPGELRAPARGVGLVGFSLLPPTLTMVNKRGAPRRSVHSGLNTKP